MLKQKLKKFIILIDMKLKINYFYVEDYVTTKFNKNLLFYINIQNGKLNDYKIIKNKIILFKR